MTAGVNNLRRRAAEDVVVVIQVIDTGGENVWRQNIIMTEPTKVLTFSEMKDTIEIPRRTAIF